MARTKRRTRKVSFDTKTVMDVGLAGLATRIIPMVVNKFFPLDPTLYSVVGAGGTYIAGVLTKKEVLANAGIALGIVELIAPMVEEIISGFGPEKTMPMTPPQGAPAPIKKAVSSEYALNDYGRLMEYTNNPAVQSNSEYRGAY